MLNKILSVIVPVYGTERYITKCLDSALLATNGLDAEIIIVNDGTKDAAGKIAQKYALEYSRKIRYFEKKNGGLADTKNYGLSRAEGIFVTFLDSDDYVDVEIYRDMLWAAEQENADCVVCDMIRENEDKSWVMYDHCAALSRDDMYQKFIDTSLMASSCNKIMRRTLLEGLQFPVGMNNEDITVTPIAMGRSARIAYVPKGMYHYVQRENSIQNVKFSEKRFVVVDAVRLALERAADMPQSRQEQLKGSLYVFQILAVALYLIREEAFFDRYYLIKAYIRRVNEILPDFFQNKEVWEYTAWGNRKNNLFRKISVFLLEKKMFLVCSVFWQVVNFLKTE